MSNLQNERVQKEVVPIHDSEIDDFFKYEIASSIGGEGVLQCLKCGACSGGCPVSAVSDYRPRKVLGNVLLGLRDQVLRSKDIWMCASCFTCKERCIQEVNFTEIIIALRNKAVSEGYAATGYVQMAKRIASTGRVVLPTHAVDKMRENLGLPPIQPPVLEEVNKILDAAGFTSILEKLSKKRDEP